MSLPVFISSADRSNGTVKIVGDTGVVISDCVIEDSMGTLYRIHGTYRIGMGGIVTCHATRVHTDPMPKIFVLLFFFLAICMLAACSSARPGYQEGLAQQLRGVHTYALDQVRHYGDICQESSIGFEDMKGDEAYFMGVKCAAENIADFTDPNQKVLPDDLVGQVALLKAQVLKLQKKNDALANLADGYRHAAETHHQNSLNWLQALEECTHNSYEEGWVDEEYEAKTMLEESDCNCYDQETCGD